MVFLATRVVVVVPTQRHVANHYTAMASVAVGAASGAAMVWYPETTWAAVALAAATSAVVVEDLTTISMAVTQQQQLQQQQRVYQLVRAIPTFTIVDRSGVPFMVVGEDAKVTGYFFVDYDETQRILDLARKSADQAIAEYKREKQQQQKQQSSSSSVDDDNDERLINPWKEARISTVPLDTAITLVTKAASQRGRNQYFQIAASALDIEDALQVTGKEDLPEGKVPLFYYENFTLPTSTTDAADGSKKDIIPLYFRKAQLEQAYRRANKNNKNNMELPPVKVTELFATLRAMVKEENAKESNSDDEDLDRLILVPPVDSVQRAEQCQRQGGNAPPFRVGERILVL